MFIAISIFTILYSLHYLIAKEEAPQNCRDWIDLAFFSIALFFLFLVWLNDIAVFRTCIYTVKYFLIIEYAHLLVFRIFYKLIIQYKILFASWSQQEKIANFVGFFVFPVHCILFIYGIFITIENFFNNYSCYWAAPELMLWQVIFWIGYSGFWTF